MNEEIGSLAVGDWRQLLQDSVRGPIDTSTLKNLIRQRYLFHAGRYTRNVDGRPTLPRTHRGNVASLVWLDATGELAAPKEKNRTPALPSIGQYLSRLAAVATVLNRGLAPLQSDAESEAWAADKAHKTTLLTNALESFQERLTREELQALDTVREILRKHEEFAGLIL